MKSKRNLFDLPSPILIGGDIKSKNIILLSSGKDHRNKKSKDQTHLARPKLPRHICIFECDCKICRDYCNRNCTWKSKLT